MTLDELLFRSNEFSGALDAVWSVPLYDGSGRLRHARSLCVLSVEHAQGLRVLLSAGLPASMAVVHRAQFEALVRATWLFYCATDEQVDLIGTELGHDSAKRAEKLPMLAPMLKALSADARASVPYRSFDEFKTYSGPALNSFVHSGLHAMERARTGFPIGLAETIIKQSNGLVVIAAMQGAVLTGDPLGQRRVLEIASTFPMVLPVVGVASSSLSKKSY